MKRLPSGFIGGSVMRKMKHMLLWLVLTVFLVACANIQNPTQDEISDKEVYIQEETGQIPEYSGSSYYVLNDNVPMFSKEDFVSESYETYSPLDPQGKCGVAIANIGLDLMPTEERGSIGQVKPSGWQTVKYDNVDGKYLYNRCHLIGFQLTGENANERNLITGTRYMNVEGMLPFENMVADYVKETGNHVLYRVTPVFEADHLVASGVQMEAMSVEDDGEGICFNVYVYNVQPGIEIDYATGNSRYVGEKEMSNPQGTTYILNTNNKKIHRMDCSSVKDMSEKNKQEYSGDKSMLEAQGYESCQRCKP